LREKYLSTHRNGSLEQSTLDGIELHFKHLVGTLGDRFPIQDLSRADLQEHVKTKAIPSSSSSSSPVVAALSLKPSAPESQKESRTGEPARP